MSHCAAKEMSEIPVASVFTGRQLTEMCTKHAGHTGTDSLCLILAHTRSSPLRELLQWTLNKESSIDLPAGGGVKGDPITALITHSRSVSACHTNAAALSRSCRSAAVAHSVDWDLLSWYTGWLASLFCWYKYINMLLQSKKTSSTCSWVFNSSSIEEKHTDN